MRVKKFTGLTLKEVTDQMKSEFGENAIILNTRKITKGGMFSFLGKDLLEITAGIDEEPVTVENENPDNTSSQSFDYILSRLSNEDNGMNNSSGSIDVLPLSHSTTQNKNGSRRSEKYVPPSNFPFELPKEKKPINRFEHSQFNQTSDFGNLKGELEDVKHTLREIVDQLKYTQMPSLPDQLRKAFVTLVGQDVNEQYAAHIVQTVYGQLSGEQLTEVTLVEQKLLSEMSKMIRTVSGSEQKLGRAKVVVFVGPTGVGKTTTIAKLAAINKLFNGQSVALISADTYRIAAIEQLRTFAAIANIEMDVVYRPGEMQKAIKKHRNKDVILIDTFGRSQREAKGLSQLRKFLDIAEPDEVHLVLSAASNEKTMFDICERFDHTKPNRLVFSKVDESVTFGPLLNVPYKSGIPISFITTGQTVPDDIVTADSNKIATMIYRGVIYDV